VNPRHVTISLVALAAVGGPVAGCGGSDSSPSAAPSSGSTQQAKSSAGSGSITITDFKFTPASLTVDRGVRVTVANGGGTAHTATADDGKSFDTGDVDPGASATLTVPKAGSYPYHCNIHPFMHGTLVVR
jgi:plastocyanin